ncbi:squalene synthetase-like protein [Coemansia sp. RSA 1933]|nr:squalene synthetase-like protein [Coemansia sp. RSA 1933]
MNDYIANMEEEEIAELLAAVEDGAYLERELRDSLECHHQAKVSKGKNAAIPYNIDFDYDDDLIYMENPMEDDMEIVDEIFQSSEDELEANSDFHNNGGYNEDDGFPCSIDPENLPGPERSPRNGRQNNGQAGKSKGNNKRKEKKSPAKNKANGREGPSPRFDPRKVLKRLDMLARSEDMSSLWMEPMNRHERQIVHIFAREYGMRSKSHGSGVRRAPVLTATQDTQIPRQRRRINRILTLYDNGGLIPEEFIGGLGNQGDSSKGKKGNGQRGKGAKCVPSGALHGRLVAADAPAVGSSNIGHKMLQQMGWQPGTGLGVQEEGRSTPVDVMIRGGRRGLGA